MKTNTGVEFITTSDTEVLLELYRIKKEKCLDDLIGMFAFAIYEIETGKLFMWALYIVFVYFVLLMQQ